MDETVRLDLQIRLETALHSLNMAALELEQLDASPTKSAREMALVQRVLQSRALVSQCLQTLATPDELAIDL